MVRIGRQVTGVACDAGRMKCSVGRHGMASPMGIVAFCPRGHRVKVKDELAGRKGICPRCQVRFRIPLLGSELPVARVLSLDPLAASRLPRAEILGSDDLLRAAGVVVEQVAGGDGPDSEVMGCDDVPADAFETMDRDPQVEPGQTAALHPAIAERPDLAWCVAVPGGKPSPPYSGEALQRWLQAGSATGQEVVWRADWPEWVPIRSVFPEFVPAT